MAVGDILKQSVGFVFNALAIGRQEPRLFRVRPYPISPLLPADILDLVTVDCTLQEIVTAETEISDHAVESSLTRPDVVSDNARNRPVELRMEGVVSDTPIRTSLLVSALQSVPPAFGFNLGLAGGVVTGTLATFLSSSIVQTSQQAYEALMRLHDQKQFVTLVTPRKSFESMMMTSLIVTRDQHTGEALRFAAAFKQVTTVSLKSSLIPDLAQAARDLGAQATSAAPAALQSKASSTLFDWTIGGKLPKPSRN